ncbi:MAG: CHASE2 domain-containing protein, partial [Spirochaetaceae bacterium]|nr:CHASE2 domain-containing protein [Spirochaetaceae bacterium]
LVFAPMMDLLDVESIQRESRSLILKNALIPGSDTRKDITIPLDRNGYMLINWLHRTYAESFIHIPVIALRYLDEYEAQIISCLRWLYEDCYLLAADGSWLDYYTGAYSLLEEYAMLKEAKEAMLASCEGFDVEGNPLGISISHHDYQDYFAARQQFFTNCGDFLNGDSLQQITTRLEELAQEGADTAEITYFLTAVEETYAIFREYLDGYNTSFGELKAQLDGAFCILGNSATGTTDMGATPFEARYANVGTHGNVYNTIVSEQFIIPLNWEWVYFPIVLVTLLLTLILAGKKQRTQLVGGLLGVLAIPVGALLLMRFGRIYAPITATFIVTFLTYMADVIFRFLYAEHDKRFLRQAFSTYLSKDIVDDLVNNPESLALGGSEKNVTALFSDIKSFSTLSEQLSAPQLVSILNEYLTTMSDVILENQGTIDKYIGDAIVSFFGAPMDVPDHAFRACASAVRMKQMEQKLNQQLVADGTLPMPILTRIGINTGKMVIGNMGTDKKMNYTMMGNNVNIAARLEGVNKAYSSWVLVSESTWTEANSGEHQGKLLARRLDKVRVMGIEKPVQLYNIMGFVSEMTEEEKESVEVFHHALDLYLQRNFQQALDLFKKAGQLNQQDKTPDVFVERCQKFIKTPPASDWSGVMTMSTK